MNLHSAIHVVSGDTAARTLREAHGLAQDRVLVLRDPVSCGPAPILDDLQEWRAVRERFLSDLHPWIPRFAFDDWRDDDLVVNFARLEAASPIVAWLGEGTGDQLFAAWLVHYMQARQIDLAKLNVVTFDRREWRNILCVGELTAAQIVERGSKPSPPEPSHVEELAAAWRCYSSDAPAQLAAYVQRRTGPIRDAVAPLLLRYPDLRSGLGFWDGLLLQNVRDHGPRILSAIGHTMVPSEPADFLDMMWDGFLFDRAMRMASPLATQPLISVEGDRNDPRSCTVEITDVGREVLVGLRNAVALNGIDDWIGGVHLTPDNVVFRNGDRLV